MSTDNLLGIAEIADLAGVSKQAVSNWRVVSCDYSCPPKTGHNNHSRTVHM